jgi:hypothetical protein
MMEDTMDGVLDDEGLEEEAEEEVEKVLFDLTKGLIGANASTAVPAVRRHPGATVLLLPSPFSLLSLSPLPGLLLSSAGPPACSSGRARSGWGRVGCAGVLSPAVRGFWGSLQPMMCRRTWLRGRRQT